MWQAVIDDMLYLGITLGFVIIVIAGFRRESVKETLQKISEWFKNFFGDDEDE